ncbi:MAG: NYN domain-containing protein [Candidatus Dojkabacteria bacterium]|jgi:uncharacterized LabA/DUF88 family protein
MTKNCYVFIDASNMFYGTPNDQDWRVDFKKLMEYLKSKYKVKKFFYYSGVDTCGYEANIKSTAPYPIKNLLEYLTKLPKQRTGKNSQKIHKSIKKVQFFKKLEEFGYVLRLKPIKHIRTGRGLKLKANCDVDLTYDMLRLEPEYDSFILLSGDGDFEILLRYAREKGTRFAVLSHKKKTARIIKEKYSREYKEFSRIKSFIEK